MGNLVFRNRSGFRKSVSDTLLVVRSRIPGSGWLKFGSAVALSFLAAPFAVLAVAGDKPATIFSTYSNTGNNEPKSEIKPEPTINGNESSDTQTSIKVEGQSTNGSNSNTEVKINGQQIPVPSDGSVHKEFTNNNSKTTVDINIDGSSGTSDVDSESHSSTSIQMESHTYSSDSQTNGGEGRSQGRR